MGTLSDLVATSGTRVRIAIVKPSQKVLFVGEVSARLRDGQYFVQNEDALYEAFPQGEIIYVDPADDIAPGYTWEGGTYVPPANVPTFEPYQIFSLFTEAERGRYFAQLDAGNVNVRSVAEMLRLQAGTKLEGTHPVVQASLIVLRTSGIVDSDARLTELGNILQGI